MVIIVRLRSNKPLIILFSLSGLNVSIYCFYNLKLLSKTVHAMVDSEMRQGNAAVKPSPATRAKEIAMMTMSVEVIWFVGITTAIHLNSFGTQLIVAWQRKWKLLQVL